MLSQTPCVMPAPAQNEPTPARQTSAPIPHVPAPAQNVPASARHAWAPALHVPSLPYNVPITAHFTPTPAHHVPAPAHHKPAPAHHMPAPAHNTMVKAYLVLTIRPPSCSQPARSNPLRQAVSRICAYIICLKFKLIYILFANYTPKTVFLFIFAYKR